MDERGMKRVSLMNLAKRAVHRVEMRPILSLYRRARVLADDVVSFVGTWRQQLATGRRHGARIRVLIYHPTGFSYGGTEKGLQLVATALPKSEYDVFFIAGDAPPTAGNISEADVAARRKELETSGVIVVRATFSRLGPPPGFVPEGINPSPVDIARAVSADLVITATWGYASYPIPAMPCPVFVFDIFGYGMTYNRRVKRVFALSEAIRRQNPAFAYPELKNPVLPWPVRRTYGLDTMRSSFRDRHGIPQSKVVFGRIGRAEDAIFDPISIDAFDRICRIGLDAVFVVVAAPPRMRAIVRERETPNVLFIESLGSDQEVFEFHAGIDVLAHARIDGESQGMNIIESMSVGNPVITHRSARWNAHLEYLDETCAFVVEPGDYESYAEAMIALIRDPTLLRQMGTAAQKIYESRFAPEVFIKELQRHIHAVVGDRR